MGSKTNIRGKKFRAIPSIFSLPHELLSEILARVGSSSLDDLFNVSLSCKRFHELAYDKYVLRQASLKKISAIPWRRRKNFFLDKCRRSGNTEALYKKGMVYYFSYSKLESGLEYFYKASKSGHFGASYILGVIYLCKNDDLSKHQGIQLLKQVYKANRLIECRWQFRDTIRTLWKNYYLDPKSNDCLSQKYHNRRKGWVPQIDDDVDLHCELCTCHREVIFVCNELRGRNN